MYHGFVARLAKCRCKFLLNKNKEVVAIWCFGSKFIDK
jgi:hypothetical protein